LGLDQQRTNVWSYHLDADHFDYVEAIRANEAAEYVWRDLVPLLFTGIAYAVADGQTVWLGERIKLQVRAIILDEIYSKILRRKASSGQPNDSSPGDQEDQTEGSVPSEARVDNGTIENLMTSDADRIVDAGANTYEIWASVPMKVIIALVLLFRLLGPSALAEVGVMLFISPINSVIIKYLGKAITDATAAADLRVRETDQLLRNTRMIKLFVWQDLFQQKVQDKRDKELRAVRTRLVWWSVMATIWYAAPFAITFVSIFVYTAIEGRQLKASTAFTALSLCNLLKAPLDQLVGILDRLQQSLLSIHRVESFLRESETEKYQHSPTEDLTIRGTSTGPLGVSGATLSWTSPDRTLPSPP
jgi:ABC-type multidrug transport system fused ATPase/permease subunit